MPEIVRPTFIGIGAQKCASTWLFRILSQHPQVGVASEKEIDFFSHRYDHGYAWYEEQFAGCSEQAIGEISPSYFCEPAVPARVAAYEPAMKIIVSLRDPVQRALSNHRHEVRVGHFKGPDLSFAAGLRNNPMYVEQGRYATHYLRWLDHFPREQILVVLMDDVTSEPQAVARCVYEFVGVDTAFEPQMLDTRFNRSYVNRYRTLSAVKDRLYDISRRPGLGWIWSAGSALGARSAYRRFNIVDSEQAIPQPDDGTLERLRSEYAPEVRKLAELLGRPLDNWLA